MRLDVACSMARSEFRAVVCVDEGIVLLGRPASFDSGELVLVVLWLKKSGKGIVRCARERGREEARIRRLGLTLLVGVRKTAASQHDLRGRERGLRAFIGKKRGRV